MITPEELARIRAIAEADKNGADGKAWDEAITPDIVIALCDRIKKQQDALNLVDMAHSAVCSTLERYKWQAPSPNPANRSSPERGFPFSGGEYA